MATLFAAVLIAMAGVMTALAAYPNEDEVPLSIEVRQPFTTSISVTGSGTFPTVLTDPAIQDVSLALPLILSVESELAVTVEAEMRDEFDVVLLLGLFVDNMDLIIDGSTTSSVDDFTLSHTGVLATYDIDATIHVPAAYTGTETATLVFWIGP